MQTFNVHILGCGSALPTIKHFPSSQVVDIRGKLFMIDCAEGTQLQLRRTRITFTKIQAVLITHLHGDHCFGLIGMISTFGLLGRTAPLHIYAPAALEDMLNSQLHLFCNDLGYDVVFHPVDTTKSTIIYEDKSMTITTLPLRHRVPCCGYLFCEKAGLPHIRREMIDFLGIPVSQINNIKAGASWTTEEGEVYENERLVIPAEEPRSYAYCSDTSYLPSLVPLIQGVSTLYHEATYGDDMLDNAKKYCHSTARQAAMIARQAGAGKLLLGHYSSRYLDQNILLNEAREEFSNTYLTDELQVVEV